MHHLHDQLSKNLLRDALGRACTSETEVEVLAGEVHFPTLIVIGPGPPHTVLDAYGCKPASPGVYEAVWGLALRIVVIAELPRTRETLLLRLLGKGRLLREALTDLAKLPDDAWERAIATPLLVHLSRENDASCSDCFRPASESCLPPRSLASKRPIWPSSTAGASACSARPPSPRSLTSQADLDLSSMRRRPSHDQQCVNHTWRCQGPEMRRAGSVRTVQSP